MSFWLSAANAQASAARGLFAAQAGRAQKTALDEISRQTVAFWTGGLAPVAQKKAPPKRRRSRK